MARLFSTMSEVNRTPEELNRVLEKVRLWARQWKRISMLIKANS